MRRAVTPDGAPPGRPGAVPGRRVPAAGGIALLGAMLLCGCGEAPRSGEPPRSGGASSAAVPEAAPGPARGSSSTLARGASSTPAPGASSATAGRAPPDSLLPGPGDSLPPEVTREMVARGRRLYRGEGLCYSCHGTRGRGVPRAGSSLRDRKWLHSDGTYRSLLARVANGVSADASASGMPMPPRGGADLTADEVRAVTAWVWWFSRPHAP